MTIDNSREIDLALRRYEIDLALRRYEIDLALRRYDVVMRYLAAEYAMELSKNQFYIAVNSGLLAFVASKFPKDTHLSSMIVPLAISLIGLVVSIVWAIDLSYARRYARRWTDICITLEGLAFDQCKLWREDLPRSGFQVRNARLLVTCIFLVVWLVALVASLVILKGIFHCLP